MYSLLADLYTEDIHFTSWTLLLYQLLSPCLFSGCGFIISVALTSPKLPFTQQIDEMSGLQSHIKMVGMLITDSLHTMLIL